MTMIRETCSCGATFEGPSAYVNTWRKEHRHEFPPPPDDPAHIEDHTGYLQDAPSTDLRFGFTTPALTTEDDG